jgi:hypothetical protein
VPGERHTRARQQQRVVDRVGEGEHRRDAEHDGFS